MKPRHLLPILAAFLMVSATLSLSGCTSMLETDDRPGLPLIELDSEEIAAIADSTLTVPLGESGAQVAVIVGRPDGRIFYSHNGQSLMQPASVQKLFVAADAMLRHPRDYRFTTSVFGEGTLDKTGVLRGDLVISGNWDPSLSGDKPYSDWPWAVWDSLAREVGKRVNQIQGAIVVEAEAYLPGSWEVGDLEMRYAPRISQLMWNDGLVSRAHQDAGGDWLGAGAFASTWPAPIFWTVDHTVPLGFVGTFVVNSKSSTMAVETAELEDPVVEVEPTMLFQPSPLPRILAADAFRESLSRAGVRGGDSSKVILPDPLDMPMPTPGLRVTHQSAPLDSLLRAMLVYSSNAWAEQIAASVGTYKDGNYRPTWPSVIDSLKLSDGDGIFAADACGMARRNRMRASTVHGLLGAAIERWDQRWLDLLPRANEPGSTLDNRLVGDENRVAAKTGTLSGCSSLAGYILGEGGTPDVTFVVLVNNAPGDPGSAIDAFVAKLADAVEKQRTAEE